MTRTLSQSVRLAAPVVVAGAVQAVWLSADGEIETLKPVQAALKAKGETPIVAHAPATARRLGLDRLAALDVLQLYAFVRPARFCLPTPRGLAAAMALGHPVDLVGEAMALRHAAELLLAELAAAGPNNDPDAVGIARAMARGGWRWGKLVLAALGDPPTAFQEATTRAPLEVWRRLPEWSEHAPEPPAGNQTVEPHEARERLWQMLSVWRDTQTPEPRPQQGDYASAATHAFTPRELPDTPRLVLAEAGTGVGKTLGYLAPATVWADKNQGPVWVSTFTRNLQHQIDRELDRLYPDASEKTRRVVIRKGRENYLCLLNFEEALPGLATRPQDAIALGLMARWARATRDGDMVGGDFPAWLADLVGRGRSRGLADRRHECIHSACPHYHKCFIERSVRRARRAQIVIANHALVMVQAALGGIDDAYLPSRYVFDEGHQVFAAADNAFAGLLSGQAASDLRLWLLGAEGGRRARARGLARRVEELIADDTAAVGALTAALTAARALPGEGWSDRLVTGQAIGPTEAFLALVRQQVKARAQAGDDPYSQETETRPTLPELIPVAEKLRAALERLAKPLEELDRRLSAKLDDDAAELDSATRARIEGVRRGLDRRIHHEIAAWQQMLTALGAETPPAFVDWFALERLDGREVDVAFHRRWVDPTIPFAEEVVKSAQGVLITSATLTDSTGDIEHDWQAAEARTGARHCPERQRASVPSPFDYAAQTKVLVVRDVRRDDLDQVASAYRELFLASGGGALGLFTAINRLKAVHHRIAPALEAAHLPLYAQHVDALDTATLIDIFRSEEDACLLGTDAVRDGVDVPGRSLRLIVFDRVPWPRPDILHKARRAAFGGSGYDDMLTRLRLKQAFGRLIRRADDIGVFVLLDSRLPTRLAQAFPTQVAIERIGLAEAVSLTSAFLAGATAE